MRQPRFAPAVPTEVMPGQPRSGTAGAVETFSLGAPRGCGNSSCPYRDTRVRILSVADIDQPPSPYVARHGPVEQEFPPAQDAGNLSWIVEASEGDFYIKTAGAVGANAMKATHLDHSGRVRLLGNAINLVRSCDHPALAALLNVIETPTSPMLVYQAAPGELIGGRVYASRNVPVPHRPTSDSQPASRGAAARSSTH